MRLRQIERCLDLVVYFQFLVNNAVKYNREQGTVNVCAQNRGDFVELKVTDTGYGIARADLPRIFDKFFRIRTENTRKVIGSGLGLPLAHHVVRSHGGTLEVAESELGGACFEIVLPQGREVT